MDRVGISLLAIVGMVAWVAFWIWLVLFDLRIGGKAIDPISTYVPRQWQSLTQWLKWPKNAASALQWVVRITAIAAIWFAFGIDPDSWLNDYRGEIAGIAFTVLVIEEVERLRDKLEDKESVIRQMSSRSNEFALDAVRIAGNEDWLTDGSLHDVNLGDANLQKAPLQSASLEGANLRLTNLQSAQLMYAKLQYANLAKANLQGAHLERANLQDTLLTKPICKALSCKVHNC